MKSFDGHAGFNITKTKLQLVEINYKNEHFFLENIDEAYFNEQINFEQDKETRISALLQGAYNELIINRPLKTSSVSFTLPLDLFYISQIPYDNSLLHQDLINEFRWELSVLYPFVKSDDLVIQYIEVEKNKCINFHTAIIIAISRKYLQLMHNFCSLKKLDLNFIDNPHLSSVRALTMGNIGTEKELILSVYFVEDFISVIFLFNDKPIYFNVIPVMDAGEMITVLDNEINNNVLLNCHSNNIDKAFITGDDISEKTVNSLNKNLGLNFIHFNPFKKITPTQKIAENKFFQQKNNSFSPSAGIAFRVN